MGFYIKSIALVLVVKIFNRWPLKKLLHRKIIFLPQFFTERVLLLKTITFTTNGKPQIQRPG